MGKYEIILPAHLETSRRRYTAQEFMAEFAARDGTATKVFDLHHPITMASTAPDDRTRRHVRITKSTEFFGELRWLSEHNHLITTCRWAGGRLGPHGLYLLNTALRTYPLRKGGKNLVRHWLETIAETYSPLRCDINRLFAYLEIRPLFTQIPNPTPSPAIYYVQSGIEHNVKAARGKTTPARASKKEAK